MREREREGGRENRENTAYDGTKISEEVWKRLLNLFNPYLVIQEMTKV